MSLSTLEQIKKKVRRLTASPSENQLSDEDLEEYIDTFYDQDIPSALKLWNLKENIQLYTVANEDEYDFDTTLYKDVVKPLYIDGREAYFSLSQEEFYRMYPKNSFEQTGPAGDGTAGPYAMTLTNIPVMKRSVTISAISSTGDTLTVYDVPQIVDNSVGDLIDYSDGVTNRGTINYITGVIEVTFSGNIETSQSIKAKYVPYQAARPDSVMLFSNKLTLRPIPDGVYRVDITVYRRPSQLLSANNHADSNEPQVADWWQYISYGAAIKILQERQDVESVENHMPEFVKQESLILYRKAKQLSQQRTGTLYSQQAGSTYGYGGWYGL